MLVNYDIIYEYTYKAYNTNEVLHILGLNLKYVTRSREHVCNEIFLYLIMFDEYERKFASVRYTLKIIYFSL